MKGTFLTLGGSAVRRKARVTQTPLAQALDMSQQTDRRMPMVAQVLGISLRELFGKTGQQATRKRDPAPKLQQQIERISKLPKQKFVLEMLETVLAQASR